MQGGQVSIWVPMVVGIIGVLGIVAGQLINAWREDRRWRREQEREELRWQRQRESELMQSHQTNIAQWREIRLKTYGRLIRNVSKIMRVSTEMTIRRRRGEIQRLYDEYEEAMEVILEASSETAIMCSERLAEHLGAISIFVYRPLDAHDNGPAEEDLVITDQDKERMDRAHNHNHEYFVRLRDLIKEELGVEVERTDSVSADAVTGR